MTRRSAITLAALSMAAATAFQLPQRVVASKVAPSRAACRLCAEPAPLTSYEDAEKRGFQFYQMGEFERAIRMFELAQTLPGAGLDYKRDKTGGSVGSANAPPNPREWVADRFASAEQKLIAEYNIACCCAAMGDSARAVELLRAYLGKVDEPLNQINEMLVDDDLLSVRPQLRELRETTYRGTAPKKGLFGLPKFENPLKGIAEEIGVEWKD